MKITINKAELLKELQNALPFVERKTTIPILSNFLLVANGDKLQITGTDLDNTITMSMSAAVKTEGTCTVAARKLTDCVKNLKTVDSDTVDITILTGNWVVVKCGPLTVKLPTMKADNFPTMPKLPEAQFSVPGATLTGLIQRTSFAICTQESRYTLNGALLLVQPDRIHMVATDGHRCANVSHNGHYAITDEFRTLISREGIAKLAKLLGDDAVEISKNDTTLFFKSGNWYMSSRILSGTFPNYAAIMPKDNKGLITMAAKDLKASLTRIAQFSDERSRAVRFTLNSGLVLSASNSETGEASEQVQDASYSGEPLAIGLNADYVLEILGTMGKEDTIRFEFRDANSAVTFVPGGEEYDAKNVVMPMRM